MTCDVTDAAVADLRVRGAGGRHGTDRLAPLRSVQRGP